MFEGSALSRIFALPPGADFPRALVAGILHRLGDAPPEASARLTVYLNTTRMLRAVRAEFDRHQPLILPRLRLVTDLRDAPLKGLPPAIPALRRQLELSRLVSGLLEESEGFAAGRTAFDLARSLVRLNAEMQDEGVSAEALEAPDLVADHAEHWERSLRFLRIVTKYVAGDSQPDAEARLRRVVEAMATRWTQNPGADPVIVAGSTGSRGTTLALMRAVMTLPQGALVLPGYDFDLPAYAWNSLYSAPTPPEDHPQFRYLRLLDALGATPADIRAWSDGEAPDAARNRLISLALRPAPVTDQWMSEGAGLGPIGPMAEGLTLIEAPTPRDEALAIALRLRRAVADGQRAALVTPDRVLGRHVAAALLRWGIVADDSGGEPLALTAPGRFLRHVAALPGRKLTAEDLLVLLKHPLAATGADDRGAHLLHTRELELSLRRFGPPFPDRSALRAWAEKTTDPSRAAWADWVADLIDAIPDDGERPLSAWIETHLSLAEGFAAGPAGRGAASELWKQEPGRTSARAMATLAAEAAAGGDMQGREYEHLLTSFLAGQSVRRSEVPHPSVMILGTLEARVEAPEVTILGGLNEGVWPAVPAPDPWLSRQMRVKAGLLSPERQIGLSAHDFQQAAGAGAVVLSRSMRDAEAPTVPSRWLARLTNLMSGLPEQGGAEALEAMRARGRSWLALASALDRPQSSTLRAHRPAPRPPVESRPTRLPVTGIRTLIRDPYAIYARQILGLRPLDPLRASPDARMRGEILHDIVEAFVRDRAPGEQPGAARDRLLSVTENVLDREVPWHAARRLWRARIDRIADWFVAAEAGREARGIPAVMEKEGTVLLEEAGFELTARPDRIDLLNDGKVLVFDYKSGALPSEKLQLAFDKQLLLEAAMAERGGFAEIGRRLVEAVTYIRLGGDGEEKTTAVDSAMLDNVWADLHRLVEAYQRAETGYAARRAVFDSRIAGDYDHLARYGEWQMSDPPEPEDVG